MAYQPAISFTNSFQHSFSRAGGRTSNVGQNIMKTHKHANISPVDWFIASYIERTEPEEHASDSNLQRKVMSVWENRILVKPKTPEEAFARTLTHLEDIPREYTNTDGVVLRVCVDGITSLLPIYEELQDGAEIEWIDHGSLRIEEINSMVRRKQDVRVGHMARIITILIFVTSILSGCQTTSSEYRIVHRTEEMRGANGQFEGNMDCMDFYHDQQRLGSAVFFYSISPSGDFALFENYETHQLMLFDRQTSKVREVADDTYKIPRRSKSGVGAAKWRESAGFVDVSYLNQDGLSRISLVP